MRHIALTLAATSVLCIFSQGALAQGALSYPMAAHVAAKYDAHHPGHNTAVIHQVSRRHHGNHSYRHHGHHSYRHYGHHPRSVVVHPPVYGHHPRHHGYGPVVHPPIYTYRTPYHYPRYGFGYARPGFSIGIGF